MRKWRADSKYCIFATFSTFSDSALRTFKAAPDAIPNMLNCGRSRNAIKTNEKSPKPLNLTPQNYEIINISQVLWCFLNTAVHTFFVTSNALRNQDFPSLTKCIRTNGEVTTTFTSDPSNWRSIGYSDGFLKCFWKSVQRTVWAVEMLPGIQIFVVSPNATISQWK